MLTFCVELPCRENNRVEKTFHIEGDVLPDNLEKLSTCLFDALSSSDRLTVNIEKIGVFDCSFVVLVCSMLKTARLLNRQVSVQGRPMEYFFCEYEDALQSEKRKCAFATTPNCYLWESLFRVIPKSAGK